MKYLSLFDSIDEIEAFIKKQKDWKIPHCIESEDTPVVFALIDWYLKAEGDDWLFSCGKWNKESEKDRYILSVVANILLLSFYTLAEIRARNINPNGHKYLEAVSKVLNGTTKTDFFPADRFALKKAYSKANYATEEQEEKKGRGIGEQRKQEEYRRKENRGQRRQEEYRAYSYLELSKEKWSIIGYDYCLPVQIILNGYFDPRKASPDNEEWYIEKAPLEEAIRRFFENEFSGKYEKTKQRKNRILEVLTAMETIKGFWNLSCYADDTEVPLSHRLVYEYEKEQIFHCNEGLLAVQKLSSMDREGKKLKISEQELWNHVYSFLVYSMSPALIDNEFIVNHLAGIVGDPNIFFQEETPLVWIAWHSARFCATLYDYCNKDIGECVSLLKQVIDDSKYKSIWINENGTLRGHTSVYINKGEKTTREELLRRLPSELWLPFFSIVRSRLSTFQHAKMRGIMDQALVSQRTAIHILSLRYNRSGDNVDGFFSKDEDFWREMAEKEGWSTLC